MTTLRKNHYFRSASQVLYCFSISVAALGLCAPQARAQNDAATNKKQSVAASTWDGRQNKILDIRGRVLDPTGHPHESAKLYLSYHSPQPKEAKLRATTDAEGRFRFDFAMSEIEPRFRQQIWQSAMLVAIADGYAPAWIEASAAEAGDVELRLVRDSMPIEGRIVDLEGRAVVGATVRVMRVTAARDEDLTSFIRTGKYSEGTRHVLPVPGIAQRVSTGADGRFRLAGMGPNRVVGLQIEGASIERTGICVVTRETADLKVLNEFFEEGGLQPSVFYPTRFEHVVGPGRRVTGTVREYGTGKPLSDVEVVLVGVRVGWEYVIAVTDQQGRYEMLGLPKQDSYAIDTISNRFRISKEVRSFLDGRKQVAAPSGLAPVTANFELMPGAMLRGRITDKETGQPVEVATIRYHTLDVDNKFAGKLAATRSYDNEALHGITGTDNQGEYRFPVSPGMGLLTVEVRSGRYPMARLASADKAKGYGESDYSVLGQPIWESNAYRVLQLSEGVEEVTQDFTLTPGLVRTGQLIGPDGKPLHGVTYRGLTASMLPLNASDVLPTPAFTATGLEPDRPRRIVFFQTTKKLAGYAMLGGDEPDPITVRLESWGTAEGVVFDQAGEPIVGAKIEAWYPPTIFLAVFQADRPEKDLVLTDAKGRFRINGLVPGLNYTIRAADRNGRNLAQAADVIAKPGESVNLVLRASDDPEGEQR